MGIDVERRDFAPSDWEEDPMDQPVSELGGALTRGECEVIAICLDVDATTGTGARPDGELRELAARFEGWARGC